MSEPSLSIGAREALRALATGIELRVESGEWKFVGPWQDESTSGVATEQVSELLQAGLAQPAGTDRVEITERGREKLSSITRSIIDQGMQWLRSRGSPSKIS